MVKWTCGQSCTLKCQFLTMSLWEFERTVHPKSKPQSLSLMHGPDHALLSEQLQQRSSLKRA